MNGAMFHFIRGLVVLLLIFVCIMTPVPADPVVDLTGTWVPVSESRYSPVAGYENVTNLSGPLTISIQEGRAFSGFEMYQESTYTPIVNESISGVISSDGKHFWRDHEGSGVSFGDVLSDNEIMDYMLFPDDGPSVYVAHLVKEGTEPSAIISNPPQIVGSWNFTHQRGNTEKPEFGVFPVQDQEGRIFSGIDTIPEENGTIRQMPVAGVLGTNRNFYAVTKDSAFFIGEITGKDTLHYVIVIPEDEDGTFVIDRNMTRLFKQPKQPGFQYPNLTGAWNITNRTVIENGVISQKGPMDDEWMVYSNQSDPFFTATRHSTDPKTPPVMEISGIFRGKDEAFLASSAPTFINYHFPDEESIEAIIMRKDGESMVFLDTLKRSVLSLYPLFVRFID